MSSINNLDAIRIIANELSDLNIKVVYVGGAVVSLYENDNEIKDEYEMENMDSMLEIASLDDLGKIRELLLKRGFTLSNADKVKCSFHYEGIVVDVISGEDSGLSSGNPWFKKAFIYLEQIRIDELKLIILPAVYFLATKFWNYHDRGRKDPVTSPDFGEIAYVLGHRKDINVEILRYPEDVQTYLKEEFKAIVTDKLLQEALLTNLPTNSRAKRFKYIMAKLKKILRPA